MPDGSVHERKMSDSIYNTAVLGGWAVTGPNASSGGAHGGGLHNFVRHLEDAAHGGSVAAHIVRGSFLNAHRAVMTWTTTSFEQQAFEAPVRDWAYDDHLDAISNQPPGAPEYTVNAVRQWRRD